MKIHQKSLIQRIRSYETWERADWFFKYKGSEEALEAGKLNAEDLLPICLGFLKISLVLLPLGYLLFSFWPSQRIAFFILAGLTITLALMALHVMDYLIKKYIV